MADKLEWLNRHFVLLRHVSLNDVVTKEGYKIRPDLEEFFVDETKAENIVWRFADLERYKCACELLAYVSHRRAAVWWIYNCIVSLNEELALIPAEETDIDSIGKSFEPVIPDFAKVEPPKETPEEIEETQKIVDDMMAEYEKSKAMVDPKCMAIAQEAVDIAYGEFERVHGIHPNAILEKLRDRAKKGEIKNSIIDPDSPIFKVAKDLKAKLQTVRQETLDTIHSVIPPKVPAYEKKIQDDALQTVYRWIVSPDETNSQHALNVGNECPDKPAGLLSLCAFWAGGNLLPNGEQIVPTPAGLAANGLCQVLLMCALHKGGTRKLKERYEHYFNLGVEVITGHNNWDESVIEWDIPHKKEQKQHSPPVQQTTPSQELKKEETTYQRWKPTLPKDFKK